MNNKLNRDYLIYKIGNKKKDKTYNFQKFKTIQFFGREIYSDILMIDNPLEEQDAIYEFKESTKPKLLEKSNQKHRLLITQSDILEEDKKF